MPSEVGTRPGRARRGNGSSASWSGLPAPGKTMGNSQREPGLARFTGPWGLATTGCPRDADLTTGTGTLAAPERSNRMSVTNDTRCDGCGAGLGEPHSPSCPRAVCWRSGEGYQACGRGRQSDKRFPWTGDLEAAFAFQNRYYLGWDLDDYDYWPTYQEGKLVALQVNRVGPGPWRVIETSPQALDLTELSFPLPHLSMQTCDDCVEALVDSPLLARLRVLQLGHTGRDWDAPLDGDSLCDAEDTRALVRLVERMPRATELYLAEAAPKSARLLAATFPPPLRVLLVRSLLPLDLGVLARNESLGNLETLILRQDSIGDPAGPGFHDQFAALVDPPALDRVHTLRLEFPGLDDACCQLLVASRLPKHLRRLWLRGDGITDAGAAALPASGAVQAVGEVVLQWISAPSHWARASIAG